MQTYFVRVPANAVFRNIDGHDYAYVNYIVSSVGVIECEPRMLRADGCKMENGEAWIYIGRMGDAIAQRTNLPFCVSAWPVGDDDAE